jgi:hypothetical protein
VLADDYRPARSMASMNLGCYPPSAPRETIITARPILPGVVMGPRFRRNFGLPSRSPTRPRGEDAAPPLAAHSDEMILAQRSSRHQQGVARILFWLGMLATIAAGVVYLYLVR